MASLSAVLSRVSLRYQIMLVGALGVLGLIGLGGAYYPNSLDRSRLQAQMERAAAGVSALMNGEVALLQARRHEKDFLLRRPPEPVARHAEVIRAAGRDLEQ